MEIGEVRKRVLQTLEQARRRAAMHREEADRATEAFSAVLAPGAVMWKQVASALRAEGLMFTVHTPAAHLRFASDRSADDFVEVSLDTARRPVAVVSRVRLSRGHRVIDRESVVAEGAEISALDDERLLDVLLGELEPFVER